MVHGHYWMLKAVTYLILHRYFLLFPMREPEHVW